MSQLSNRLDQDKFQRLLNAEHVFRASIANNGFYHTNHIPDNVYRFLSTGTTDTLVNSGSVVLNEHEIVKIVLNGQGSVLVRHLTDSCVANSLHIKYHICLLVNIAFFSNEAYNHSEYHRYLKALRCAALSLFSQKVQTPTHLENFIIAANQMGTHVKWSECFGSFVASWYLTKTATELKKLVFLWPLSKQFTHSDILTKCSQHFKKLKLKEDVMRVIDRLSENNLNYQKFSLNDNLSDYLSLEVIISNLWNIRVANSLTATDKARIEYLMYQESYCKKASVLEALLVLKKYEANHNQTDLDMIGYLRGAYRVLCDTETCYGVNVAVIPCIFKSESHIFDKAVLLEHQDLSAALLEDFMRNYQTEMYIVNENCNNKIPNFFSRCELPRNVRMFDVQNVRPYNPINVIIKATSHRKKFDSFVIVCVTNNNLDMQGIYDAIKEYRRSTNFWAKLIVVAVDRLNTVNSYKHFDNVLFLSGVNEGTAASLWDYMKRKYTF